VERGALTKCIGAVFVLLGGLLLGAASPAAAEKLAGQPLPWQMNFQPSATPVMDGIWDFWTIVLVIITLIAVFVSTLLVYAMWRFSAKRNPIPSKTTHNTLLEVIWTAVPVLILVLIAIPSFKLHYFLDVVPDSQLTIKAIGHQFFWTHEYPDQDISFDSIMIDDENLEEGQLRLLEVDNRMVIPADTTVRLIVTASDVIHSWAVPAFGVKIDAIPGRLNEIWIRAEHEGVYYGQCSELCGAGHGYMPIAVEVVSQGAFNAWVVKTKAELAANVPEAASTTRLALSRFPQSAPDDDRKGDRR
jgi:cytochrome c oxidase subunit 2